MAIELSAAFDSLYAILPVLETNENVESRGVALLMPGTEVRINGLEISADGVRLLDLAQHPVIAQPGGERASGKVGVLTIREQISGRLYHIEGYDRHEEPIDVDEAAVPQLLASLADALQSSEKPRSTRSLQPSSVLYLL